MVVRGGRVRFKAGDIWDIPDDGKRYQVINGDLDVSPAPGWRDQVGSGNLFGILWQYVRANRLEGKGLLVVLLGMTRIEER